MDVQDHSDGPDRCRGNLNCQQWHDQGVGWSSPGTVNYNCCCCDPCHYIRPRPLVFTHSDWEHCTRCVPRAIILAFIPYDDENVCCRTFSVPMFRGIHQDSEFISVYSGALFGVSVTVELGSLPTGIGDATACAWRIVMSNGEPGIDTTIGIDHDAVTSLSVPTVMMENVEGPDGCMGYLTLLDNHRRKVPFARVTDKAAWKDGTQPNPVDKFITLDPPTGECVQVCSRICATGYRHADSEYGYTVFEWFDDCYGTGTVNGCRGWEYTDPVTMLTERFYLEEDEYGRAVIRPDLEQGAEAEIYDPVLVDTDRECSCRLKEDFYAIVERDGVPTQIVLTIRCGECTCWDYHCGGCRCVPETLCVIYWDGETVHDNLQLTWDSAESRWGTEHDPLMLHLVNDDIYKVCRIVPMIDGVDAETVLSEFPTYSCTKETASHQFDPSNEFLSVSFQGEVEIPDASGAARRNIAFTANAPLLECNRGFCTEATPCYQNCGSHPPHLLLQFRQWGEIGDFSEPYAGATCDLVEVDLVFVEQPMLVDGQIEFRCGYVGYFVAGQCCVVKVELRMGEVHIMGLSFPEGCQNVPGLSVFPLTTETCNPYYAQSDVLIGGPQIDQTCLNCTDQTLRQQVTIVEAA